ncbi:phospholipase D-like domain-containing protein [Granulicella cerasi]|uniref:phospholipase D n=1 Tax=Granulicella cerasi TaxID=741063 RepID=A0ABW1Z6E5_9BACT|nr:phospholipase D-like domain-containing protein [Granulicella cerasi]
MKLRSTLLLFALLPLAGCRSTPAVNGGFESHYAPAENLEAIDTSNFRTAQRSIELCAYSLTDHLLAQELINAGKRGVRVRIYLDQVQTQGELAREDKSQERVQDEESDDLSKFDVLRSLAATPNVSVEVKRSKTLMHLKSYVVDGSLLRSGSANFSPTGEKRQDNDLTLTRDTAAVGRFERNFEVLWARRDNVGLDNLRR